MRIGVGILWMYVLTLFFTTNQPGARRLRRFTFRKSQVNRSVSARLVGEAA